MQTITNVVVRSFSCFYLLELLLTLLIAHSGFVIHSLLRFDLVFKWFRIAVFTPTTTTICNNSFRFDCFGVLCFPFHFYVRLNVRAYRVLRCGVWYACMHITNGKWNATISFRCCVRILFISLLFCCFNFVFVTQLLCCDWYILFFEKRKIKKYLYTYINLLIIDCLECVQNNDERWTMNENDDDDICSCLIFHFVIVMLVVVCCNVKCIKNTVFIILMMVAPHMSPVNTAHMIMAMN